MVRFGVTLLSKPVVPLSFQSVLLRTEKKLTRLLRPFCCSLFRHQLNQTTIKSTNNLLYDFNPLLLPPPSSFVNPLSTTNRVFHTMSVLRNESPKEPLISANNNQSSSSDKMETNNNQPVDPKDKKGRFKALIRDYGVTAVIFHITISLASLGICYLLVNSSLPMEKVFVMLGIDKKLGDLTDAASSSTNFVVAYAVHKSMALIRLSITAACVPVIVRYLRSKGIIKQVPKVVKKAD